MKYFKLLLTNNRAEILENAGLKVESLTQASVRRVLPGKDSQFVGSRYLIGADCFETIQNLLRNYSKTSDGKPYEIKLSKKSGNVELLINAPLLERGCDIGEPNTLRSCNLIAKCV